MARTGRPPKPRDQVKSEQVTTTVTPAIKAEMMQARGSRPLSQWIEEAIIEKLEREAAKPKAAKKRSNG
jgi:hypothetical protein